MKEYFEAMDRYIDLKIKYRSINLSLSKNYYFEREIKQAKCDMEEKFLLLIHNKLA